MKKLLITTLIILATLTPTFAQSKAYTVTTTLKADSITIYNKSTKQSDKLNWYLTKEDIKRFSTKGNTWLYDYENDILYRMFEGTLYNMNEEE